LPNSTPLELIRKTWPLACSAPSITLRSLPITRLRMTAEALGWLKFTVSRAPTLKLCQSMAALWDAWSMVVTAPLWPMVAVPLVTTRPGARPTRPVCSTARRWPG
jgi:hypothetical protein